MCPDHKIKNGFGERNRIRSTGRMYQEKESESTDSGGERGSVPRNGTCHHKRTRREELFCDILHDKIHSLIHFLSLLSQWVINQVTSKRSRLVRSLFASFFSHFPPQILNSFLCSFDKKRDSKCLSQSEPPAHTQFLFRSPLFLSFFTNGTRRAEHEKNLLDKCWIQKVLVWKWEKSVGHKEWSE